MNLRLKIVRIFNKNVGSLQRLHWPELTRYCGCCQLSIGIYIRCIIGLLKIVTVAVFNGFYILKLLDTKSKLQGVSIILVSEEQNSTLSDEDSINIQNLLTSLMTYYIVWMVLKFVHVLALFATFYAIFCDKPRLLRAAVYTIFPNWVFDIIIMIGAKVFLNPVFQIVFLLDACTDGYNLLAMNSQYKKMALKSRIIPEEVFNPPSNIRATTPTSTNTSCTGSTTYCVSCYNSPQFEYRSEITRVITPIQTPSEDVNFDVTAIPIEADEQKVVNFKDGPIIFNQEQLQVQNNSLFLNSDENISLSHKPVRPQSLNLKEQTILK